MSRFWVSVWFGFGVIAFFALMLGYLLGERWGFAAATAGLALLGGLQLYYLYRVNQWLEHSRSGGPQAELPAGLGAWQPVFVQLRRARAHDQRRSQEAEQTLTRFMEASSALPDGIIILDRADRIEWCNPSACQHFGLELARDRGFLIANLVRRPAFTEYLVRANFREPLDLTDPAGALALSVQFLPFQQTRRIILSRDVTALKRVEAMRRDFIANVSHELRTPLTVVSGFLEQMVEQPDIPPAQRTRFHTLMLEQAGRMQRLIEDLITLSRLESERAPSMEESIPASDLMRQLLDEAAALSNRRHRIESEIAPGLVLSGAVEELRSAFGNLISNAIRYTPAGGSVRVTLRAGVGAQRGTRTGGAAGVTPSVAAGATAGVAMGMTTGAGPGARLRDELSVSASVRRSADPGAGHPIVEGAVFSVTDTCPGIAPEHLPRLTERFYRVDKSRSRETGGTGLGLAIVKHILARHGGQLDIESTLGQGSRFSAILPAARVHQTTP